MGTKLLMSLFLGSMLTISFFSQTSQAEIVNQVMSYEASFGSGYNPTESSAVVGQHDVSYPGVGGMRIHFHESPLGQGNYLKITYANGKTLTLDDRQLYEYNYSTPYLNGDFIRLELVVASGSVSQGVYTRGIEIPVKVPTESICGSEDNRIPSNLKPFARMMRVANGSGGCSGTLIGPTCMVSAGHCTSVLNIAQFNVPPSNTDGTPNYPEPQDQYPLSKMIAKRDGGPGNDWAVFRVKPNPVTNKYAGQVQGMLTVSMQAPAPGTDLQITGYGTDRGDPVRHVAQQTNIGPLVSIDTRSARLRHQVDTMPGNSGSSVLVAATQEIIGIHTHGGCRSTGGENSATSIAYNQEFANAVRECLAADAELWNQIAR